MSASNTNNGNGPNGPPPLPPPPAHSNFNLLTILTREKLTGPNYLDWIPSLRIGLRYENKEYVLDHDLPELYENPVEAELAAYNKDDEESTKVACLMLVTMSSKLQKSFENTRAYDINYQLQEMFQEQARQERFEIIKSLMACMHMEGASVCAHVQKMKCYIDRLENLGVPFIFQLDELTFPFILRHTCLPSPPATSDFLCHLLCFLSFPLLPNILL